MADAIYTQADLDRRLEEARRAAREGAWLDIMGKFEPRDRRHVASLLAYKWHVASVTVDAAWARQPSTVSVAEFDKVQQRREWSKNMAAREAGEAEYRSWTHGVALPDGAKHG